MFGGMCDVTAGGGGVLVAPSGQRLLLDEPYRAQGGPSPQALSVRRAKVENPRAGRRQQTRQATKCTPEVSWD